MRYTTIIDISQLDIYRNQNARLVYLHLCLIAGYNDSDRDLVDISIRRLAAAVGISVSATRHALSVLERAGLLAHRDGLIVVRKWISNGPITPRAKSIKEERKAEAQRIDEQAAAIRQRAREEQERQQAAIHAQGKTSFMIYYEDMMNKYAAGDISVKAALDRHRATYEAHKKSMETKNN